ncbi:MAG: WD40 repeat domain-containing protein [Crocinitomicaceae bacterium]
MKKIIVSTSLFFLSLIAFWSCKTDFSVNGSYKITPIVYGLLDQNDSIHYIRITKTFLGDGNALDFAKVADSSYFTKVAAKITEVIGGSVTRSWILRDTILHNKDVNGAFFAPDQKLYYFVTGLDATHRLQDGATYNLEAILNDGAYKVTGSTQLVTGVSFTPPANFSFYNESSSSPYKNPDITWNLGDGQTYNVKLNFHYNEIIGGVTTDKNIPWNLKDASRDDLSGSIGTTSAPGKEFYDLVSSSVSSASVDKRVPSYFEIVVTAGAKDLETYILANKPSSSLAQSKPSFTNIDGGIGIFSARTVVRKTMLCVDLIIPCNKRALDQKSTKFLCTGAITGTLGFCSNNPQDGGTCGQPIQSFYCN